MRERALIGFGYSTSGQYSLNHKCLAHHPQERDVPKINSASMHIRDGEPCPTCAEMRPNMICGRCEAVKYGRRDQALKRKAKVVQTLKGAFGLASILIHLTCSDHHRWISEVDYETEEGLREPQCPTCQKFAVTRKKIIGVYSANKTCTKSCWEAEDNRCTCSCTAARHGTRRPSTVA